MLLESLLKRTRGLKENHKHNHYKNLPPKSRPKLFLNKIFFRILLKT